MTATVLTYNPAFSTLVYNGSSAGVNVTFSTCGKNQTLSYNKQSITTMLGSYVVILPAGQYTLILSTVGTNPIVSTSAVLNIANIPLWSVTTQPLGVYINSPVSAIVEVQFITSFTASLLLGSTVTANSTWSNTANVSLPQYVTLTFTPLVAGTYTIQL